MKETLIMFTILVTLSIINGLLAKNQNKKGKTAPINWFACGFCGVAAVAKLVELLWN